MSARMLARKTRSRAMERKVHQGDAEIRRVGRKKDADGKTAEGVKWRAREGKRHRVTQRQREENKGTPLSRLTNWILTVQWAPQRRAATGSAIFPSPRNEVTAVRMNNPFGGLFGGGDKKAVKKDDLEDAIDGTVPPHASSPST